MYQISRIFPAAVVALFALTTLPGCFTGVERTPVIKAQNHKTSSTITPEEALFDTIVATPPAQWTSGKEFILSEGHPELAYKPADIAANLHAGDTLRFLNFKQVVRLSGDSVTEVSLLTPGGQRLTHVIESPLSIISSSESLSLPFAIDLNIVERVNRLLAGRKLWTLTTSRYNLDASPSAGKKFSPVSVIKVTPGSSDYPLHVIFSEPDGSTSMLLMVTHSKTSTARTFNNLFSLSDPRKKYPAISDENWNLICRGQIALDMTREECRLALGTPANVERNTTYAGLIERWTYENGIYLFFTDGRLTQFRR